MFLMLIMSNNRAIIALIVAILFVSVIVGTILYFQGQSDNEISKINVAYENFTHSQPSSIVFGISAIEFSIYVQNTGNVIIQNSTLTVNLTLSNGETADFWPHLSYPIDSLGIGENQQVTGTAVVKGVSIDVSYLGQTWSFVLTTPEGIVSEPTYFTVEEKVIPTPTPIPTPTNYPSNQSNTQLLTNYSITIPEIYKVNEHVGLGFGIAEINLKFIAPPSNLQIENVSEANFTTTNLPITLSTNLTNTTKAILPAIVNGTTIEIKVDVYQYTLITDNPRILVASKEWNETKYFYP